MRSKSIGLFFAAAICFGCCGCAPGVVGVDDPHGRMLFAIQEGRRRDISCFTVGQLELLLGKAEVTMSVQELLDYAASQDEQTADRVRWRLCAAKELIAAEQQLAGLQVYMYNWAEPQQLVACGGRPLPVGATQYYLVDRGNVVHAGVLHWPRGR